MLDIALIILGLGIIGSSYVISEKVEAGLNRNSEDAAQIKDIWTEKDEKRVRERIDSIVEERVELAIDKTEDELSRISNEKIMSSNEFSEQVLGKIEQNHEEVVFLYNMLNEKEKQMKTLMQEIETLKTAAEEKVIEEQQAVKAEKVMTALDMLEKMSKEAVKQVEEVQPKIEKEAPVIQMTSTDEKELSQLREFAKSIEEEEKMEEVSDLEQESVSVEVPENGNQPLLDEPEEKLNRNDEILTLHRQGMTVLEISKALDMGQGEVKLIIDLFQGANEE